MLDILDLKYSQRLMLAFEVACVIVSSHWGNLFPKSLVGLRNWLTMTPICLEIF